jgi:hypothetical protein
MTKETVEAGKVAALKPEKKNYKLHVAEEAICESCQ